MTHYPFLMTLLNPLNIRMFRMKDDKLPLRDLDENNFSCSVKIRDLKKKSHSKLGQKVDQKNVYELKIWGKKKIWVN